jgi:hypothetical protein
VRLPASLCLAVLLVHAAPLAAQEGDGPPAGSPVEAAAVEPVVQALFDLAPDRRKLAPVADLVLERPGARFRLAAGSLQLLAPVGGRTVGFVFRGQGTLTFTAPTPVERERLRRRFGADSLVTPFTGLAVLFTDGTGAELESRLGFAPGEVEGARGRVEDLLEELGDRKTRSFHPDLLGALLNGSEGDGFAALVTRQGGDLLYTWNPAEHEGAQLAGRSRTGLVATTTQVFSRFAAPGDGTGRPSRRIGVEDYVLDVALPRNAMGEVRFSARAEVRLIARSPVGPWVMLSLFDKLEVDSASWKGGGPAAVAKAKDSGQLWVRLDRALAVGETRTLVLDYHGDLIDRYVDFFFIKSSASWYPRPLDGRSGATFDITYHTPTSFAFASVGEQVDSTVADRVLTTRWLARRPIRNASFNLGLFEARRFTEDSAPPVTVLYSDKAHRLIGMRTGGTEKEVGVDIAKALRFFGRVYGPTEVEAFHATEIPYGHGEAFPGLVHLSATTFLDTDRSGADEIFRAHEVAHQWWGIEVDFDSYRDQWLSEGFAEFSGLWYLHAVRGDGKRYLETLRRYRDGLFLRGADLPPTAVGFRAWSEKDPLDYQKAVYEKGAWILHMLRVAMVELKTMNEDRFTAMMRDFHRGQRGRRATTADFQRVAERHVGMPLDWFFQQWVEGSALPTYRVAHRAEPEGEGWRVRLQVEQRDVPETFRAWVPVTVRLKDGREARFRVHVTGATSEIVLPLLLPAEPKEVVFNDLEGVLAKVERVGWK